MTLNWKNINKPTLKFAYSLYELTDMLTFALKHRKDIVKALASQYPLILMELVTSKVITRSQAKKILSAVKKRDKARLNKFVLQNNDLMFIDDVHNLRVENPNMVNDYIKKYLPTTSFND